VITNKGLHRRKGRNAPDELVARDAERFAVGQGTLVWAERDRLWSAPLPK
jgi:hypothetical protein